MGEIKRETEPNVLKSFAHSLGTELKNRRLDIPGKFGTGYCAVCTSPNSDQLKVEF